MIASKGWSGQMAIMLPAGRGIAVRKQNLIYQKALPNSWDKREKTKIKQAWVRIRVSKTEGTFKFCFLLHLGSTFT